MPKKFDNLEIEVSRCLCKQPEVRILGSPLDRPRERFVPLYDLNSLTARLEEFEHKLLLSNTPQVIARRKKLAQEIGLEFHSALLPGGVGKTFTRSISAAETNQESHKKGLRIRITFGRVNRYLPEIVGLPWELLCDPESLRFPGSEPHSPIIRHLDRSQRITPLRTSPPLRVLAILSSPNYSETLRIARVNPAKDREILQDATRDQKIFKIHFLERASLTALRTTLERHRDQGKPFHALHFLGHGEYDESGESVLFFENSARQPRPVSGRSLAKQLVGFDELRLAFLTTCVGARILRYEGQHPFTGVASALIDRGFPAVVAMQFSITEAAASHFASSFYDKIAAGRTVVEAVTEGRLRMAAHAVDSFEWASPVLFLRTPDGKVLDIQTEREDTSQEDRDSPETTTIARA